MFAIIVGAVLSVGYRPVIPVLGDVLVGLASPWDLVAGPLLILAAWLPMAVIRERVIGDRVPRVLLGRPASSSPGLGESRDLRDAMLGGDPDAVVRRLDAVAAPSDRVREAPRPSHGLDKLREDHRRILWRGRSFLVGAAAVAGLTILGAVTVPVAWAPAAWLVGSLAAGAVFVGRVLSEIEIARLWTDWYTAHRLGDGPGA